MAVLVMACALLLLYFEDPGPLDGDWPKSISDGLREHPGFGLVLALGEIVSLARVHSIVRARGLAGLSIILVLATALGDVGILVFPDNVGGSTHNTCAIVALRSPLFHNAVLILSGEAPSVVSVALLGVGVLAAFGVGSCNGLGLPCSGASELVMFGALAAEWARLPALKLN